MTPPLHGGPRPGAGRKPGSGTFGESTQPVRVPESQVPAVVAFLEAYREQKALEDEGVRAQNMRRTEPGREVHVPLMGYRVPAGFASPADDYVEDTIDLNAHLIRKGHEAATFIVRASGWSMFGAGIHDGDEVVVDRALEPTDGSVVVAAVDGELLIKRLRIRGGKPVLVSENPHFPERIVAPGETLEIWGVATRVLHKL
ncbi:SOS response UmuD protein [Tahibacter aquaticus]|uniref:SOS response UmuD protein n=1 Tax=Tahibacter aquaticus TaxID=520092 RepID=A0A4R6YMK1_9GAMM|nr:translesion error-prone DNA polymerase V autoproteolytic subunit [Tahibacter aquaticus]TDR38584.1 SOS response UmuD protein [Tahibacter aquaticus]